MRSVAAVPPSGRATSVVEPPPSRLSAGVGAEGEQHLRGLRERRAERDLRLAAVGDQQEHRLAAVLEADRGARGDRRCRPAASGDAVLDERLVGADRPLHLLRGRVLEAVGERDRVAGLERLDGVGAGVAADEVEARRPGSRPCRRRCGPRRPCRPATRTSATLVDAAHAAAADLAAPRGRVGDDAAGRDAAASWPR